MPAWMAGTVPSAEGMQGGEALPVRLLFMTLLLALVSASEATELQLKPAKPCRDVWNAAKNF